MKKTIIAFVTGFALATAGSVYAENIASMIGKKVQVEYDVIVNGKQLDIKAIAIDGKSYAPIRAFSESVDYDLAFTNNTVILNDPAMEGSEPMVTETSNATEMSEEDKETVKRSEDQIILAQARIDENKAKIIDLDQKISEAQNKDDKEFWSIQKESAQFVIDENEKIIESTQAYIAKIKAKYEQQ